VAASFLSLLVNPYLWRLPLFLFQTATIPRPEIIEWKPLSLTTAPGLLYLLLIGTGVWSLVRTTKTRQPVILFVLTATVLLPFLAVRHLSLFALAYVVFLSEHLANAWSRPQEGAQSAGSAHLGSQRTRRILTGLHVLGVVALVAVSASRLDCLPLKQFEMPSQAIGMLKASGVKGNLAIFFDYGEYALWHLKDDVHVSMDGRRETVYPDSIYREALRFQAGVGDWDSVLDDWPTDMALVPILMPTYNLLKLKAGWSLAHEDDLVALFVHDSWPGAATLLETTPPALASRGEGLCFP
jgi:hypothetical protein